MTPYLAIIKGVITFANWVAQSLQQHHDELNGANAQKVQELTDDKAAIDADHIRDAAPGFDERVQSDHGINLKP